MRVANRRDLEVIDAEAAEADDIAAYGRQQEREAEAARLEAGRCFASTVNCFVCGRFKREPAETLRLLRRRTDAGRRRSSRIQSRLRSGSVSDRRLDVEAQEHELDADAGAAVDEPAGEAVRLFEPEGPQLRGQTALDLDDDTLSRSRTHAP